MRDCINARTKRVLRQLFPANHKHVDGLCTEKRLPLVQLSLLEHYIRKTGLRDVVRQDLIAGDVTGQWNLMVDWSESKRKITRIVKKNPIIDQIEGESVSDLELTDPTVEEEDLEEEVITESGPEVIAFATEDIAVVPPTCIDLQRAQLVAIRLRLHIPEVEQKIDEGVFILPEDVTVEDFCSPDQRRDKKRPDKKQTNDAGIKTDGTDKYVLVYAVYTKLPFEKGEPKQESVIFFAGQEKIIGLIKNPLWSGRRPILSSPIDQMYGSFFGKSKIEPVKYMQWQLCDFANMAQDSAMFSVMPVFKADPISNPIWQSMVVSPGAVWAIAPGSLERVEFGTLWKDALEYVGAMKMQIRESLDVNELMLGATPKGRKNNQLMGAMMQEQSTNIVDHASRYEERILNPLLEMLFEFDQQYRDRELTIETRGEFGYQAAIETIPVQQWEERYFFRWVGSEASMSMQRSQQQIAFLNVLKGTPPQQLGQRRLDQGPILERLTENLFGPELAPLILVDMSKQFTIEPDLENEMLHNGFDVDVHPGDDDQKHLQKHIFAANLSGDPMGLYKKHNQTHMAQLQAKRQEQMAQQQPKGLPGTPGGGPGTAPPQGVAGSPAARPGAMPAGPGMGAQNPAGAIPQDAMPGAMGRG